MATAIGGRSWAFLEQEGQRLAADARQMIVDNFRLGSWLRQRDDLPSFPRLVSSDGDAVHGVGSDNCGAVDAMQVENHDASAWHPLNVFEEERVERAISSTACFDILPKESGVAEAYANGHGVRKDDTQAAAWS